MIELMMHTKPPRQNHGQMIMLTCLCCVHHEDKVHDKDKVSVVAPVQPCVV